MSSSQACDTRMPATGAGIRIGWVCRGATAAGEGYAVLPLQYAM
jgi:hypothetical protein